MHDRCTQYHQLISILRTINRKLLVAILSSFLMSTFSWADENEDKFSSYFQNVSGEYSRERILELWGYHDSHGNQNYLDTIRLRYYQPLDFDQFRGTLRLDTAYVSTYGPSFPNSSSSQYSAGNTMLTFWGNHPSFLPSWGANLGARVVFPFGNHGQWAIGPQVGASFRPSGYNPLKMSDFSPLARYMYGFDAKNNSMQINPGQPPLVRNLQLFPTLGFQLAPSTQIRLWDENGVVYNSAGGGWFVPLDAMITHRLSKNLLFAIGASKQVVQTYNQYDWSVYGKISLNF